MTFILFVAAPFLSAQAGRAALDYYYGRALLRLGFAALLGLNAFVAIPAGLAAMGYPVVVFAAMALSAAAFARTVRFQQAFAASLVLVLAIPVGHWIYVDMVLHPWCHSFFDEELNAEQIAERYIRHGSATVRGDHVAIRNLERLLEGDDYVYSFAIEGTGHFGSATGNGCGLLEVAAAG